MPLSKQQYGALTDAIEAQANHLRHHADVAGGFGAEPAQAGMATLRALVGDLAERLNLNAEGFARACNVRIADANGRRPPYHDLTGYRR